MKVFLVLLLSCLIEARTAPKAEDVASLVNQLESDIRSAEEDLECGDEPVLSTCETGLSLLAYKYCQLSNKKMGHGVFAGVGKSVLSVVGHLIGGSQVIDLVKGIGYAFSSLGHVIVGNTTTARRHIAIAGDSLRAFGDPTVWVADIGSGVTEATAANVYSCTASIAAAYHAFKRQGSTTVGGAKNCKHGTCGTRWLSFINRFNPACTGDGFPKKCAMPGLDHPNPFLRRIVQDSGCPDSIKGFIRRRRSKVVYWVDLMRYTAEAAKKDPAVLALLAFRIYGETFLTAVDYATTGFVGLVVTKAELGANAQNYFIPVPERLEDGLTRPTCDALSEELLGAGPKKEDDGLGNDN